jgi:hypothetical protein
VVSLTRTDARLGVVGLTRTNQRPLRFGRRQRRKELAPSLQGEDPPPPATVRALPVGIHQRRRGEDPGGGGG